MHSRKRARHPYSSYPDVPSFSDLSVPIPPAAPVSSAQAPAVPIPMTPVFRPPSTSALTTPEVVCTAQAYLQATSPPHQLQRTHQVLPTPDDALSRSLADLDAGLGLTTSAAIAPAHVLCQGDASLRIERELDALLSKPPAPAIPPVSFPTVLPVSVSTPADEWSDDVSCVSGSGGLKRARKSSNRQLEETSSPLDVLNELRALDARSSTTVVSPPLRRRRSRRRATTTTTTTKHQ